MGGVREDMTTFDTIVRILERHTTATPEHVARHLIEKLRLEGQHRVGILERIGRWLWL